MPEEPTARTAMPTRGPRLMLLLVALAILPLFGVASIGLDEYRAVRSTERLAETTVARAADVARLDELRLALIDERNWVTSAIGLTEIGVPPEFVTELTGVDIPAEAVRASAVVDELLSLPPADRYVARVAEVRAVDPEGVTNLGNAYLELGDEIAARAAGIRDELAARAASIPVGAEVLMALGLADAATSARYEYAVQLWSFFTAEFSPLDEAAPGYIQLATQRDRTSLALDEIGRLGDPRSELGDALTAVRNSRDVQLFDASIAEVLTGLLERDDGREQDVNVVAQAIESADIYRSGIAGFSVFDDLVEVADRQLADAGRDVADASAEAFERRVVGLAVVAVLALAVAIGLARYIGAPMVRLAVAAKQLGSGAPIDVRTAGPAEVRRVGIALEAAAAGLALVERLEHQATHDELTGVPTRGLMHQHLDQSLARSRRSGQLGAAMFVDIDHFKDVNDTYGHAVGDVVLTTIAERLRTTLRLGDELGRFGGDEFVVIAESVTTGYDAAQLADRLVAVAREPIPVPDSIGQPELDSLVVTVSIGVAVFGDGTEAGDDVLRRADEAVYGAKANGRDGFVMARGAIEPVSIPASSELLAH